MLRRLSKISVYSAVSWGSSIYSVPVRCSTQTTSEKARLGKRVGFRVAGGQLRVEVHDAGEGHPAARPVGELDESGRGLLLVELLSEAWGVSGRTGIGKCVWAVIGPTRQT